MAFHYCMFIFLCGPGSSVGIGIELQAERSGIESRWGRDFPPVHTGLGAHPASCKMDTGSYSGVKSGRGVLLNTHPPLVPRSWKSRAIPLPTFWATPCLYRDHLFNIFMYFLHIWKDVSSIRNLMARHDVLTNTQPKRTPVSQCVYLHYSEEYLWRCYTIHHRKKGVYNFVTVTFYWLQTYFVFDFSPSSSAVAQWLRCCATNRKVAGSIPDGVIGIFHWHNPSDRSMALGSTQPLTEMRTRSISWG